MTRRWAQNSGFFRRQAVVLALLSALAIELAAYASLRRSMPELEQAFAEGSTAERIAALHVLTHRGQPWELEEELVRELLAWPEVRMGEFLLVEGVVRNSGPAVRGLLQDYADWPGSHSAAGTRRRYLLHKPKGLESVLDFLMSCRDEPITSEP